MMSDVLNILKDKKYWLTITLLPPFLAMTNHYIPFGGLPFHQELTLNSGLYSRLIGVFEFQWKVILVWALVVMILFYFLPQRFWKRIMFVLLGLNVVMIVLSYL